MAGTMMQVLDTTIANVALPHMRATLGASQEQVAWVLTSYIVASAIAMPVTGFLESRFGRRGLFTIALVGFTLSSAACGLAVSLPMMIAARILQGVFGAFINPLGQAVMFDSYPKEKHAQAMTIWGMGVMIGPIMGPILGGWLTDAFDWRWVFFINVPIGIAAIVGGWLLLPPRATAKRRFDIAGFVLLGLALASFQLMLDRGTDKDWLDSPEIIAEIGIAIAALWMFVIHSRTTRAPIIPLAVFRDRNFVIANVFVLIVAGILMAGAALTAPMLQGLLGYSTTDAGLLIAPRGIAMALAMFIAGRLSGKVDPRLMIGSGLLIIGLSQHWMTGFSLEMDRWPVIWTGAVQGFGIGLTFLPLNLLAFATLPQNLRTEGAALYNLARSIGGSIAIAVTTALVAYNLQVSHSDLTTHVSGQTLPWLSGGLPERFGLNGEAVLGLIDMEVNRQALMIAYLDDFWLMGWAALLMVPLVLVMRPVREPPSGTALPAEAH